MKAQTTAVNRLLLSILRGGPRRVNAAKLTAVEVAAKTAGYIITSSPKALDQCAILTQSGHRLARTLVPKTGVRK